MHRKWLESDGPDRLLSNHPKYIGFEGALKKLGGKSSDSVESVARFPLPFAVETHMDGKHNMSFRGNTMKMLYLDLKAVAEEYAVVNDFEDFEQV